MQFDISENRRVKLHPLVATALTELLLQMSSLILSLRSSLTTLKVRKVESFFTNKASKVRLSKGLVK